MNRTPIFWQKHNHIKVPIVASGLVILGVAMILSRIILERSLSALLLVQISTTLLCVISLILYRTRYSGYAVHLLLMTGIISIFGTGGLDSAGLSWLPLVPFLAAFLGNNLSSVLYSTVTLLGLVFFWIKADSIDYGDISLAFSIVFACGFAVFLESVRIKYERAIVELATSNPLTELPSRVVFDMLLDRATGLLDIEGVPFVLVFIDVNRLKTVNDTFGHPVGDELLKEVGRRLNKKIKSSETLFHISGDEFVIVADHTPDLEGLKTRIRGINGEFVYHDFQVPLSISVGATDGTTNSKATLAAADDDMYVDKRRQHKAHG